MIRDPRRAFHRLTPHQSHRHVPAAAYREGIFLIYDDDPAKTVHWSCERITSGGTICGFTCVTTGDDATLPDGDGDATLSPHVLSQKLRSRIQRHLSQSHPKLLTKRPLEGPCHPPAAAAPPPSPAAALTLREKLAVLAISGGVAFRVLESAEMRAVLEASAAAGRGATYPDAKTLASHAEHVARRELHDTVASFAQMPCAITYDGWGLGGVKYVVVTATSISPEFQPRRAVLAFLHNLPDHTSQSIADGVRPLLSQIGTVLAATTDGARNMRSSAGALFPMAPVKEAHSAFYQPLFTPPPSSPTRTELLGVLHVPCMLHVGGLALTILLRKLGEVWERVRKTLGWLHQSVKAQVSPPPTPLACTSSPLAARHSCRPCSCCAMWPGGMRSVSRDAPPAGCRAGHSPSPPASSSCCGIGTPFSRPPKRGPGGRTPR